MPKGQISSEIAPARGDNGGMQSRSAGVDHYENFPVASWLCPAHLRPAIQAIYHFARTADDIADEGNSAAADRLTDLQGLHDDLERAASGAAPQGKHAAVVNDLTPYWAAGLPKSLLTDLLSAFAQDVRYTANAHHYDDWPALLDYCQRSANPVGRLLLHLYGVTTPHALAASDAVCTALQLINFWQDLSQDLPRGRYYVPVTALVAQGLTPQTDLTTLPLAQSSALIKALVAHARSTMAQGYPVVNAVPGRASWELATVIQGGLHVLRKIERNGYDSAVNRHKLTAWDGVEVFARTLLFKFRLLF